MKGLILTYILAIVGTFGSLVDPLIGLAVYMTFSVVRPQVLFGWAGNLDYMSFAVGVALLVGWALKGLGEWSFGRARGIVYSLLAFYAWFVLSAVFAQDPVFAFGSVIERAKVVLPFLVGMTLIKSERWITILAWVLVLGSGYVGGEMNWSYFNGYNRASAEGLLGDNNSFAVSMVAAVGPAIFLGLSTKSPWKKALAFGCALLCMHTVLLTFSRGGILSLAITGAVVALLMPKRPAYLLALVLTAAIGVRLMGPEVTSRFMTTFAAADERDASAESRIQLWQDCLVVMERHPAFGVGPWHWPRIAPEFGWTEGKQAHSFWMQLGAECGVPALLLLLSFYVITASKCWVMARRSRGTQYEALGLYVVSGLTGFIISAQFVSMEGLEVPYYLAMVGAAALKIRGDVNVPIAATAAVPDSRTPPMASIGPPAPAAHPGLARSSTRSGFPS
jgi:O-antigen ligase